MPVTLYCGNDEYSIDKELQKLRKSVLQKDFADLNRKVLVEKAPKNISLREIVEVVETTPMMFGNLLIEVHATSPFLRGKTEEEKWLDRLVANLKDLSPTTHLVFVCVLPVDSDKKVDSAKKLVKTIKAVGEIKEFNVFKFYETAKVVDWILKLSKSKKVELSRQNAELLQSLAGSDFRTLDSELEKLKTYILPKNEIAKEDIINLSQDNEDAFAVLDLWLKGDKFLLFEELDKLLQKDAPQKVIALFQTTIKRWLRIKLEAQYGGAEEIARNIGAHPFFVQNEMQKLRNVSKDKLLGLRKNLNKAEFQMKSGELAPNIALETALVV